MFAKYCKSIAALMAVAVMAVAAATTPVQASISFTLDSYTVSANSGSGLIIETDDVLGSPYDFTLTGVGDSVTVDLFDIWTPEQTLNLDDLVPQPIEVAYSFTAPTPPFGDSSSGSTGAATLGFITAGYVDWDSPTILSFGPNGDGQLEVTLSNEFFNGNWGTNFKPGREHGATVEAKFKLLAEPSDPVGVVPEPTTVLVWSGLALVGLAAGRRFVW